jgi:hypothetical protein
MGGGGLTRAESFDQEKSPKTATTGGFFSPVAWANRKYRK